MLVWIYDLAIWLIPSFMEAEYLIIFTGMKMPTNIRTFLVLLSSWKQIMIDVWKNPRLKETSLFVGTLGWIRKDLLIFSFQRLTVVCYFYLNIIARKSLRLAQRSKSRGCRSAVCQIHLAYDSINRTNFFIFYFQYIFNRIFIETWQK